MPSLCGVSLYINNAERNHPMNQKKLFQIIVICVVAVWVFCASLMISTTVAKKANRSDKANQPDNIITTTAEPQTSLTTEPSTSQKPTDNSDKIILGNNLSPTVNQVEDPDWKVSQDASKQQEEMNKNIPVGKDNIIKAYVNGINKLKDKKDFTLAASGTLDIEFDQITGGAAAEKIAGNAISENAPKSITYNFVNGLDEPTGETPITAAPPMGSYAKLSSDAVRQATATGTGDGGYVITITLKDENQTLKEQAKNHSTAIETIDLDSYMPAGMKIEELTLTYSGATVEAVFDKENRLSSLRYSLPIAQAQGKGVYDTFVGDLEIDFRMHGEQTRSFTVTY